MEITVETNTGEVATFTDGSAVIRQRPTLNPLIKFGLLQPDTFKWVFAIGITLTECLQRSQNPGAMPSSDGEPVGSNLPTGRIKKSQPKLIGKLRG
jgi:hypothetical protein